ncbi:RNA-binding protein Musashi Rbp6-like isoform X3 [Aphis craccivora]|uniref:RNA-binding protein Musashi Rbp6-like isoform X3 n=1 Tax=Aphis craccivora TaxID=307492 RepID=A0A6G0ZQB5_APHCR|nr:RNA-binding protein Musashi Rbp6-like isoform X3 [Aphis craccivora]
MVRMADWLDDDGVPAPCHSKALEGIWRSLSGMPDKWIRVRPNSHRDSAKTDDRPLEPRNATFALHGKRLVPKMIHLAFYSTTNLNGHNAVGFPAAAYAAYASSRGFSGYPSFGLSYPAGNNHAQVTVLPFPALLDHHHNHHNTHPFYMHAMPL